MNLNQQIQRARPNLSEVSPLVAFICWAYGFVNILIGLAMIAFYKPTVEIAIANIFSYPEWGVIFFLMGASTVYGLISNRWKVVKYTQLTGILVKAIWALALIARSIVSPSTTILITMIWLFFAAIQIAVFIYFPTSEKK